MTETALSRKMNLIRSVGEEIISETELRALLKSGKPLTAYDGFEPSGQIHIAQGILRAINVNRMIQAGISFKMMVADWHAMANNKLDADLAKIKTTGEYFIEVWRASGMNLAHVEFVWASDLVKDDTYWQLVIQVGRTNALRRFIRTAEMMGRQSSLDSLTGAHIIYSCMQVADIFTLGAHITQLGMDQRKVNVLAREVGPQLGFWKPVIVSHHMLRGLQKPPSTSPTSKNTKLQEVIANKMSKSKPDTAIFMTDSHDDIKRKIGKAWAPEGETANNPILEYCRYLIFPALAQSGAHKLQIERPARFGGTLMITSYDELEKRYADKELHPMDLKNAVIRELEQLVSPVRTHFEQNKHAKSLLAAVKSFAVTR